jgi:uncharacterized SAM-binding protein YcdF (DUF218 family)
MQLRMTQSTRPWLVALVVVLLVAATVAWRTTLVYIGASIIDSQAPTPADLILVLGGDFYGPRVLKAADLVTQGYAPLVLISGPPYQGRPEGEFAINFLANKGYRPGLFSVLAHNARSTIEEAIAVCPELRRRQVKHVILVTSSYHSRRAEIVFRLFCPGIRFTSVPGPDLHYDPEHWWADVSSRDLFLSEWSKIFGSVLFVYPEYRLSQLANR